MWIGEQIDEYGIGNGISLLIMAGILAQMPASGDELCWARRLNRGLDSARRRESTSCLLLAALFVGVIIAVVAITQGQRRIPIQSAKHVRGRRTFGGQRQFLPLQGQSGGRDADYLRLQPADVSRTSC